MNHEFAGLGLGIWVKYRLVDVLSVDRKCHWKCQSYNTVIQLLTGQHVLTLTIP